MAHYAVAQVSVRWEDGRGMLDRQSMTQALDNAWGMSGNMGNKGVFSVWVGGHRVDV